MKLCLLGVLQSAIVLCIVALNTETTETTFVDRIVDDVKFIVDMMEKKLALLCLLQSLLFGMNVVILTMVNKRHEELSYSCHVDPIVFNPTLKEGQCWEKFDIQPHLRKVPDAPPIDINTVKETRIE